MLRRRWTSDFGDAFWPIPASLTHQFGSTAIAFDPCAAIRKPNTLRTNGWTVGAYWGVNERPTLGMIYQQFTDNFFTPQASDSGSQGERLKASLPDACIKHYRSIRLPKRSLSLGMLYQRLMRRHVLLGYTALLFTALLTIPSGSHQLPITALDLYTVT
jgi:hypothetical protein